MIRKAIMLAVVCVFAVLAAGLVLGVAAVRGADATINTVPTSKLGDRDNFGYGRGTGPAPAPCAYFDNREPEDLGVFDYESPGSEEKTWTHTFPVTGTPKRVTLTTWEIFSDDSGADTIELDGHVFPYAPGGGTCDSYPEGGVERVHELIGADAAVAADGVIVVTFRENGDDISIDRATLKVKFG